MNNTNHTISEFSAGCCVFKRRSGQIRWLVGLHSGYHKWVLPKGRLEAGETAAEAAIRETQEEAGVVVRLLQPEPIHTDHYTYQAVLKSETTQPDDKPIRRVISYQEDKQVTKAPMTTVNKRVDFFVAEYRLGSTSDHSWEMHQVMWIDEAAALRRLAFEGEKLALKKAALLVSKM